MTVSEGDSVTIEYTGRHTDGTVFDSSRRDVAEEADLDGLGQREFAPLTVDVGEGNIVPGLEDALVGMDAGEEKTVEIPPERGYGERTDDRIVEYERAEFEGMLGDTEVAEGLRLQTQEGLPGEVTDFDDDTVTVDFNHELAGEELVFEVEVVDVQ